jgi:hypothetical protein
MDSNVSAFIKSRRNSLTQQRIKHILSYVMECHKIFLNDGITYSKSALRNLGTVMFEDYLKFEFVEKYLVKNKSLLKIKISELEEINFACETQQRYLDVSDNKVKPDKIDIYVNKLGLKNIFQETEDENIYFAIECKRIQILSDLKDYVLDIENKFVNRNHLNLRLPFEGQIAFIENEKLTHKIISDEVNTILRTKSFITYSFLTTEKLHSTIDSTYSSIHKRNFGNNDSFLIYHLMFNYSKVVLN